MFHVSFAFPSHDASRSSFPRHRVAVRMTIKDETFPLIYLCVDDDLETLLNTVASGQYI